MPRTEAPPRGAGGALALPDAALIDVSPVLASTGGAAVARAGSASAAAGVARSRATGSSRTAVRVALHSPAVAFLVLVASAACAAAWLTPHDPAALDLDARLLLPHAEHPLGTDQLGRDLLARLLHGGRATLGAALAGMVGSLVLGVGLGLLAGYFGGWLDAVIGGATEVALALPGLTLALALAGLLGPSLPTAVLALVAVSWTVYARVARAAVLAARERPHVLAARALGAGHGRLLRRHVLPELLGTLIVLGTLDFSTMLLALAGLGFIGLGVQPPWPEWGAMLADGRGLMQTAPQLMLVPGLALGLTALCANLAGDALRDSLSPWERDS